MAIYTVIITRDITESCTVEVRAKNKTAAHDKALTWLENCDNPEWEVDDGSCGISRAYVTDVSEA